MTTLAESQTVQDADKAVLREIKQTIRAFLPDAEIILFGSVARGTSTQESDYDILVITDTEVPFDLQGDIRDEIESIEMRCERIIGLMFFTGEHWNAPHVLGSPFRERVDAEGVVL